MTEYGSPFKTSFNITVGETGFLITTVSNSTVSDLNFNVTSKRLGFNVTGPSGTTGFCNITIPAELMSGDFSLYIDMLPMFEGIDYSKSFNGTHYLFSINYTQSNHLIDIYSTIAIPDFAGWFFPPFLMIAALLAFTIRKRMKKATKPYL